MERERSHSDRPLQLAFQDFNEAKFCFNSVSWHTTHPRTTIPILIGLITREPSGSTADNDYYIRTVQIIENNTLTGRLGILKRTVSSLEEKSSAQGKGKAKCKNAKCKTHKKKKNGRFATLNYGGARAPNVKLQSVLHQITKHARAFPIPFPSTRGV